MIMTQEEYFNKLQEYNSTIDAINKEIKEGKESEYKEEKEKEPMIQQFDQGSNIVNYNNQNYMQQQYGNAYYTNQQQQQSMYNNQYPVQQYGNSYYTNQNQQQNYGYNNYQYGNSYYTGNNYQQPYTNYQYQGASINMPQENNNPYYLKDRDYYNSEQYMRDFQYGWNLYHDQNGNDISGGNYIYNGAYVSIPSSTNQTTYAKYIPGKGYYDEATGTFFQSGFSSNNNYQQYGGYSTGYYGYYDQQTLEMKRQEAEQQEQANRLVYSIMFKTVYGTDPQENLEEFEDFYIQNVHPEMYQQRIIQKHSRMTYAELYGFEGNEKEVQEFNRNMSQIEPVQRCVEQISYIRHNHPERFLKQNIAMIPYDVRFVGEYQKGIEEIIPKEKQGKLTFAELNQIYMPRIIAFTENIDSEYKKKYRTPTQRYSQSDYRKLTEFHRVTRGQSPFDPTKVMNGEEIHLPSYLYDKETKDKRRAFLDSIVNQKSNINKGALY